MKILVPLAQNGKINPDASLRDAQSTIIKAPLQEVWDILSDIEKWPEWNPDIKSASIGPFKVGSEFKWTLNGSTIKSTLQVIKEPELMAWTGTTMGTKTIHVWKLEETEPNQTIVSAEESLEGLFTLFLGHQRLHDTLLKWLERLKQRAEGPTSQL